MLGHVKRFVVKDGQVRTERLSVEDVEVPGWLRAEIERATEESGIREIGRRRREQIEELPDAYRSLSISN